MSTSHDISEWPDKLSKHPGVANFDMAFLYGELVLKCRWCEWEETVIEDEFIAAVSVLTIMENHYHDQHFCDGCAWSGLYPHNRACKLDNAD